MLLFKRVKQSHKDPDTAHPGEYRYCRCKKRTAAPPGGSGGGDDKGEE